MLGTTHKSARARLAKLRAAAKQLFYLPPIDSRGQRLRAGSEVRIVGVPDLSGFRDPRQRREVQAVFRHLRGQRKKIHGFSGHGFAEIFFKVRKGRLAGWHGVEIEPNLLLLQRPRRASAVHRR